MAVTLLKEETSIVIVGDLNPTIFVPYWFVHNGLMDKEVADGANVEVIHRDICIFQTPEFHLHVDQNRLIIKSLGPTPVAIYDLINRTFGEFLIHTNLRAAGINYQANFRVPNEKSLHDLGDRLAPKEPWGEWGRMLSEPNKSARNPSTRQGGLRRIMMEQSVRPDGKNGLISMQLEPINNPHGIVMLVNDHYAVEENELSAGSGPLLSLIKDEFDTSINRAKWMMEQITRTVV
jgi:hypothetical protein